MVDSQGDIVVDSPGYIQVASAGTIAKDGGIP
jgi:hypothetical protein